MEYLAPLMVAQAVVNGLLLGLIYTAMSIGLSLTMGIMRVVNVAHSTFVLLGAYVAWELSATLSLDPILSIVVILPLFFLVGMLVDKVIIRRITNRSEAVGLLALFGLLVMIESASILVWTNDTRVVSASYSGSSLMMGDIALSKTRLLAGAMALIIVGAIHLFLQYTLMGKTIRAMAQNRDAAMLMGVNVPRTSMIVFGIGTATAAVGGVALAMVFAFAPADHITWLAWAFLVVILGGLGSVRNSLVAGLLVGEVEALAGILLPFQYVYVVLYLILALSLVLRGRGLVTAEARTI